LNAKLSPALRGYDREETDALLHHIHFRRNDRLGGLIHEIGAERLSPCDSRVAYAARQPLEPLAALG
jgi:hypothetical protein